MEGLKGLLGSVDGSRAGFDFRPFPNSKVPGLVAVLGLWCNGHRTGYRAAKGNVGDGIAELSLTRHPRQPFHCGLPRSVAKVQAGNAEVRADLHGPPRGSLGHEPAAIQFGKQGCSSVRSSRLGLPPIFNWETCSLR